MAEEARPVPKAKKPRLKPARPAAAPAIPAVPAPAAAMAAPKRVDWLEIGLVLLVALYVLAVVVGPALRADPRLLLSNFSTRFLSLFIEAAPFLLAGSIVSGLIGVFVSQDQITRWVPRNPFLAVLLGALLGFAFPVCECGVVPVVRQLYHKRLPMSMGIAFLLAAPVMNPIVVVSTATAFGFGSILLGRYVITLVVAVAIGLVFIRATPRSLLLESQAEIAAPGPAADPHHGGHDATALTREPLASRLRQALIVAGDEFVEMGRYLVLGALLASGMQTLVTQDALLALGRGPWVSVLAMQLIAFVLSVCSTVDAFLALAFARTFTTGSILAFLTFGPMVDIKSTLMFLGVFRRRTVVWLIVLPLVLTFLIGVALNLAGGAG